MDGVHALEMNVSCPNIKKGGVEFGTDPSVLRELVKQCRAVMKKPLIIKLTPNCTDVVALARAAMEGGADGLSVINTLSAMAIDARKRRPRIATTFGGLSGPAIKPIALRMVYEAAHAVDIPVIGIGGITTGEDVVEFMLAGAAAVQVGTANYFDPCASERIVADVEKWCIENRVRKITDLIGGLDTNAG